MGRRSALLDFDDLALELIARAQLLHSVLLPGIRPYGTMPPRLRSPSATVLHRLPRNDKHLNCLPNDALKRGPLAIRPRVSLYGAPGNLQKHQRRRPPPLSLRQLTRRTAPNASTS